MINKIKTFFGAKKPASPFTEMLKSGAIIIDVRSKAEFAGGHVRGAINIPVDMLPSSLNKLSDKNKTIITCCASGARSASAKNLLDSNGYTNVYNGGGWKSLDYTLNY